jgi:FkbM family methyltransferase
MSKGKPSFYQMLAAVYFAAPDFFFIQIGANDGVSNDPIHDFVATLKPSGVLIEPQPDAYERLARAYPQSIHPNLSRLNVAVWKHSGEAVLYRIRKTFEETYKSVYRSSANASGITSLNIDHVKSFLIKVAPDYFQGKDLNDYIEEVRAPMVTPQFVVDSKDIDHIDLLVVDAEGADGVLVREFLKLDCKLRPKMIYFESKGISSSELCRVNSLLLGHNYTLYQYGGDTCAVNFPAIRTCNSDR